MDAIQCMIVDIEKLNEGDKAFITERVSTISENANSRFWNVQFKSSPKTYQYSKKNLLYFQNPEYIDLEDRGLYINNKHITDIKRLIRFTDGEHTFYHVILNSGYYKNLIAKDVYVTREPIREDGGTLWDYLCKIAAETGLQNNDKRSILADSYKTVDLCRDNIPLAVYLDCNKKLKKNNLPSRIYYPFGCNASQKKAVEMALTNQVSIIQGPPGTGKTQTILNIISNLIMAGKSILVVSNNNSAVDNIAEKLEEKGLGFIVAKLGSSQNRLHFIENQPIHPDMTGWLKENISVKKETASSSLKMLSQGFYKQERLAKLKAEYEALEKEGKYNDMFLHSAAAHSWLNGISSAKLIKLLNQYMQLGDKDEKPSVWFRLKWSLAISLKIYNLLAIKDRSHVVSCLETAYYISRKKEIESELKHIEDAIRAIDIEHHTEELRSASLSVLKNKLAQYYKKIKVETLTLHDIKETDKLTAQYPVVLSTTYSARKCVNSDSVFDYVIMDEASQVDITTGVLALSCASNAVIVGDEKQLTNVIDCSMEAALKIIIETYKVEHKYNALTHNFLQSCTEVFAEAPITMLHEHYRCHPQIIEFCNKRFYDGELITMTNNTNVECALQAITTKGNHARGHINQREIDVIMQEIMPNYSDCDNIGIITPYRDQANAINEALGRDIASTVHKYQGRECDIIIMSMVDNNPTEFSDNANLMNVAISRAKLHLHVVASNNDIPQESNLGQLISYIQYNNFEVKESSLHSVFDLLYKQFTAERLAFEAKHIKVSSELSENLIYDVLTKAINELKLINIEVLCHYPLSKLIIDFSHLNREEAAFVSNPFSHVDFLIYNTLTKKAKVVIEVDGWKFHNSDAQKERDNLKDNILAKFGLLPIRISTTHTVDVNTMKDVLSKYLQSTSIS